MSMDFIFFLSILVLVVVGLANKTINQRKVSINFSFTGKTSQGICSNVFLIISIQNIKTGIHFNACACVCQHYNA